MQRGRNLWKWKRGKKRQNRKKKQDAMKYRLADAMKVCMRKMPVEKITVKEIVAECQTTRQTFYRHFQDKYDLINWYFDPIFAGIFYSIWERERRPMKVW